MSSPQPKDKELYAKTKEKAKKKFKVYPSIYANSWLVSEYKKAYAKKHGEGKEAYTGEKPKDSGLPKWFDEEWIDLSKSNPDKDKWVQCGRPKANQKKSDWKKDYPKCYPKSKAKKLWKEGGQKAFDDAVKRKRKAVNDPDYKGGKPTYVATKKAEEEKVISQNNQSGFLREGLLTEAGVIGASLFVVGATLMQFELKGITDKKWWRYAGLFVAGASLHLIYEAFGLNRKYCETAFEAEKINQLDKEFKKLKPKYDTWREKVNWDKKDPKRPRKDDWKKDIEWKDELSLEADDSDRRRGWGWGRSLQDDDSPASSSTYGGYYSYGDNIIRPTREAREKMGWTEADELKWKSKSHKKKAIKRMQRREEKERIEREKKERENRIYRQDRYFCQRYNDLSLEERPTYSTRYRKRGNRCGNCGSRECLSRAIEYQEDRKRRAKVYGMRDEIIEGGMIPAWFTAETFESEGKPTSVEIKRSTNKEKKLMAIFTYPDGKTKTTHFGARGMSDYTKHGDKERMERYLDRHNNGREDWNDPTTAGALSRWVLWNKPSLSASFNDFKKRFKLKGDLKVKKSAESFRTEYTPNQELDDYKPQDLVKSSAITGDFFTDSLKYSTVGNRAESFESETVAFESFRGRWNVGQTRDIEGVQVKKMRNGFYRLDFQGQSTIIKDGSFYEINRSGNGRFSRGDRDRNLNRVCYRPQRYQNDRVQDDMEAIIRWKHKVGGGRLVIRRPFKKAKAVFKGMPFLRKIPGRRIDSVFTPVQNVRRGHQYRDGIRVDYYRNNRTFMRKKDEKLVLGRYPHKNEAWLDIRYDAESFEADSCIECGRKEGPYSDTKLVACKCCPELTCQHCDLGDKGCKFCFGKDKYRAECNHQFVLGAESHYTDGRPMTCPICVGELSSYSKD